MLRTVFYSRHFSMLCNEMGSTYERLLLHTEVRWNHHYGKILRRISDLRNEVHMFLSEKKHRLASYYINEIWLSKLNYLVDIFETLKDLNLSFWVDRSECDVRNCWEQWTQEGTHARKTGSGETRKTTRREDRRIVQQALVDPTVTRSTIRLDVGVAIVPQTISRHLAEANLKFKRHFRSLLLTPEHRQMRLQWCQARSMWNVTDGQKVVFSDESWFVLGTDDNRVRVWRRLEHVWDQLKRQMPSCHSVHDLELAVQDLWAHLPQDNIRTSDGSVIAGSSLVSAVKSVSRRVPYKTEVTHVEQHAYIKIAVLRERNAMECHSELVEVLGNSVLPYLIVARWIGKFQQGRVSTSDEQHLGRPVSVWTDLGRAVIEQLMDYIKGHGLH
ncbi:zinc finger MYM-type protein 6 [Trichonephila clavipes]|nr:zinc finger MYM-type protein 6 [Trichonephila clavipes]